MKAAWRRSLVEISTKLRRHVVEVSSGEPSKFDRSFGGDFASDSDSVLLLVDTYTGTHGQNLLGIARTADEVWSKFAAGPGRNFDSPCLSG